MIIMKKKNNFNRGDISQKSIKWSHTDNETATGTAYHGYYSSERMTWIEPSKYNGNRSLCNRYSGVMDENERFIKFEDIKDSGLKRDEVCLMCLKIYDKLPNN